MKFASTGIRVSSPSLLIERKPGRAGFMLLEALVALALVLAFAAVLGPFLFQARRIMSGAESRVAAQALLHSLLDVPLDRAAFATSAREGKTAGLLWRIIAVPLNVDSSSGQQPPRWTAYRVVASVSWGPEQEHTITAETMRLGRAQ